MSTIPASQIVTLVPGVLPAAGDAIDLNGLALTLNPRVPIGSVVSLGSLAAVQSYFGPTSDEAAGAAVYFAGFSTSTKKPGAVLFAQYPLAPVSAWVRGGSVSQIALATLQGYSGTLSVTIDGVLKTASVNLSAATSFSNAAEIIAADLGIHGVQDGAFTASVGGTFTCTSSGTTLTVGAVLTGVLSVGDVVTGTDGTNTIPTGTPTTIVSQLTGTPGGVGTYQMSAAAAPGNLSSCTVTADSTVLHVTAVASGQIGVADVITGSGVSANCYVAALGTGTGGIGTYVLSFPQTIASEAMVAYKPGVAYDPIAGAFQINSGTTGASSTITYGSGAMATDLKLTSATGAILSQGVVAAVPGTFMTSIIAITQNWASFLLMFDPDNGSGFAQKMLFSQWTNAQQNRYAYIAKDSDAAPTAAVPATSSFGYALAQANLSGTILDWEASNLLHDWFVAGWAASLNFDQTGGRTTLAFRSQAGLSPAVTDGTVAINLGGNPQVEGDRGNGYNFYGVYGTGNDSFVFMNRGFVSGPFLWADSYVNQIKLNNSLQVALLSFMTQVGTIPFNSVGAGLLETALADQIQAAGRFGTFVANVALSNAQIAEVNAQAGANIAPTLQNRGWYVQIVPATATVRASRGPQQVVFWYVDGQSVQSINLGSIAVQ
jgi:hypothetical protein